MFGKNAKEIAGLRVLIVSERDYYARQLQRVTERETDNYERLQKADAEFDQIADLIANLSLRVSQLEEQKNEHIGSEVDWDRMIAEMDVLANDHPAFADILADERMEPKKKARKKPAKKASGRRTR